MTATEVYRALWRHKVMILVLTAVFVGATYVFTSREAKTYDASTLVRIQQRIASSGDALGSLQTSGLLAQTYATVIDSGALDGSVGARLAAARPGHGSFTALSASAVQDLELLWITASSHDPGTAAAAADATAAALGRFAARTSTLGDQVVTVRKATVPASPSSPNMKLNLALALVLGLVFNGALALLIEVLRDRMPDPEELGQSLGYPVLATIPSLELHRVVAAAPDDRQSPDEAGVP